MKILESGNLLYMARLNFRVKCNNQLGDIRSLHSVVCFLESRHFLWDSPVRIELYICVSDIRSRAWNALHQRLIKWQAKLLRICSFPPHVLNG